MLLDALQPKVAKAILEAREFEYKAMKDMSLEEERSPTLLKLRLTNSFFQKSMLLSIH